MKKLVIAMIILLTTISGFSAGNKFSAGIDLASVQDCIPRWSDNTTQVSINATASFSEDFSFRVPLSFCINERSIMLETGIFLVYHPWEYGPFAGLSLLQFGFIAGDATLEKNIYSLNEALFGWTFAVTDHFLIEPSVSVKDPSGIYRDEYSALKGEYPCYKTVRFHLAVCWQFWSD